MNEEFDSYISQLMRIISLFEEKRISGPKFFSDFNDFCENVFKYEDLEVGSEEQRIAQNIVLFQNTILDSYMNYDPQEKRPKEFSWLFGDRKLRILIKSFKLLLHDWGKHHRLSPEVISDWEKLLHR